MNPITIITISCLIASVSCANFPKSSHNLQASPSQLAPQALAAPNEAAAKAAAQQAKLHYVEIDPSLKGNYKFGYDTGSGPAGQSFREETRLDDGTVKGAYGYVDANGKQRIVKYTAGKAGFVVEGDQEAPGQAGQAAQRAEPGSQPAEIRRPQAVNLPQQVAQPQQHHAAQPQFDDQQPQINRNSAVGAATPAEPTAEDRARAEQLHAEGLRQHQLATQAALEQQQKLAQQLHQLQQQQIAAAQRQSPQQQQPRQQTFQQQQQQPQQLQQQFASAPQAQQPSATQQHNGPHAHPHHEHHQQQHPAHIVDPQSGSFFSSSNDANLNQLLQSQLRQLQSGNQFAGQQFSQPAQQQHHQQQFLPQQPQTDFNQLRAARQVAQRQQVQQQPQFAQHQGLSPANALASLHQQHQQDAQMLAAIRAQQLARLQEQSRQAPRAQQQFEQPRPQFQAEPKQQEFVSQPQAQFVAQQQQQPVGHRLPGPQASLQAQSQLSASAPTNAVQPEIFGPPVIDIRTLNYSIGQQTRV